MRHRKKKNKINRSRTHTKATFISIASSVIENERIVTTLSRAKKTRPIVDKLITLGKKNNLSAVRTASKIIPDKNLLKILFDEVAPRFKKRSGGYTRIVKSGYRNGDNAAMAILELVEKKEKVVKPKDKKSKSKPDIKEEKDKEKKEEKKEEDKKGFVGGLRGFFKKQK